jgi:hypothetical protein
MHPAGRVPVFRRPIPGTARSDGRGPWPYLWIEDDRDLEALYDGFRDLVTVTAVTQPGHVPRARGDDAVLLKQHFVFDPALPDPPLSRRARARLRRCEAEAAFEVVADPGGRAAMSAIYDGLVRRRGLRGGFFDHDAAHFTAIAALEDSVFFRVADGEGIGAMACGVVFAGLLQILHMAMSEAGLRRNASYLLMRGLQEHARAQGLKLLTGGMPDGGAEGLRTFKARWANRMEPVYLLRIVNDGPAYAALCGGRPRGDGPVGGAFFPAYRRAG